MYLASNAFGVTMFQHSVGLSTAVGFTNGGGAYVIGTYIQHVVGGTLYVSGDVALGVSAIVSSGYSVPTGHPGLSIPGPAGFILVAAGATATVHITQYLSQAL